MPRAIVAYYNYLKNAIAYLLAISPIIGFAKNWNRFNWTNAELTYWQNAFTQIDPMYTIYIANPKGNPTNTHDMHTIITNHHDYDKINHSIDRIAAGYPGSMISLDYTTFHIRHNDPHLGGSLPTEKLVSTLNFPTFSMVGIGGGTMHYIAKATSTAKRGKILAGHVLCMMYLILNEGDATPTTIDQLTKITTSTRANNKLPLGANLSRKRIAISMYWKHKTHSSLDGPPSPIQVIVIV